MAEARLSRKLGAEFLGTAALVMCGPGTAAATVILAKQKDGSTVPYSMAQLGFISLAFTMVIIAMIYTFGHISGCHINPAVTLALAAARKSRWSEVPGYLSAQFAGGIVGAFAIWSILGRSGLEAGLGVLRYDDGNGFHAFSAELIGTFLLVLVVFGTATDSRAAPGWYGLAIPAIVFAVITVVAPVTGAALNPARYIGPMIAAATLGGKQPVWDQAPTYIIAAFIAGLLAAAAYAFVGGGVDGAPTRQRRHLQAKSERQLESAKTRPSAQKGVVNAWTMRAWVHEASQLVAENAQYLTHLDAVIGDADHGVNMRRGLGAAVMAVDNMPPTTPGAVMEAVGQAFMSNLGGAAGPLYGSGFLQAAQTMGNEYEISAAQLGVAFQAALAAIQELGAAAPGEKTMVDAWDPAVVAYRSAIASGGDLGAATRAAAEAAVRGRRATAGMQARKGRASYIGVRSIGHEDPGAASTEILLRAFANIATPAATGPMNARALPAAPTRRE